MNDHADVSTLYQERHEEFLLNMAKNLEDYVTSLISERRVERIDRISARAKDPARFDAKATKKTKEGEYKYQDPLEQIQDQIGLRIVVFYLSDVDVIEEELVNRFFQRIERKEITPDDTWQFSYFGRHFILQLPNEAFTEGSDRDALPFCFELQVKTLFQHAWSEAGHDLAYKPMQGELSDEETRKLAYTAAQAWGADQVFHELFRNLQE